MVSEKIYDDPIHITVEAVGETSQSYILRGGKTVKKHHTIQLNMRICVEEWLFNHRVCRRCAHSIENMDGELTCAANPPSFIDPQTKKVIWPRVQYDDTCSGGKWEY